MTRWHASTELRHATEAVVAKTVYLAARYMGRLESGCGMELGAKLSATTASADCAELLSAELDTSG
jgi:hypothetical protein